MPRLAKGQDREPASDFREFVVEVRSHSDRLDILQDKMVEYMENNVAWMARRS